MTNPFAIQTVRVKAATEDGFVSINAGDFDQSEHELFDQADAHLVPKRSAKVEASEAADIDDLKRQLADALDRATEAESERDEWKARAEAAEGRAAKAEVKDAAVTDPKDKKAGK